MKQKRNPWSGIRNLQIRGPRRICYARVQIDGVDNERSLHIEADPEGRNRADVIEALRAFRLGLAKDAFSILQLTRSRDRHSKFGALFEAYRTACKGRDIRPAIVESNITWMIFIVRYVHGEFTDVEEASTSLCTEELLIDYRARRIANFKREAEENNYDAETYEQKFKSRMATIKSSIQQARSLFAVELRQEKPYRVLALPDLTAFMAFRSGGSTTRAFEMPAPEVLEQLRTGAALFKGTNPKLWFSLVLTANLGMRRGSARNARWSWFTEKADGGAVAKIRRAKGTHSFVGVSPATWAEMKRLRIDPRPDAFLLPGETDEDREAVLEELKNWLRGVGFNESRLPIHEMRGLFANQMKSEHSLSDAQGGLGHSSQKVMLASYIGHGTEKSVDVV